MSTTSSTIYEHTAREADSDQDPESKTPGAPEKHSEHVFPDGGAKAWLVVLGCWCTSFASFGIVNSFGVYETYYLEILPDHSPSTIAWIGSIQAFALFSATLISGPLTDRYGPMVVIWPMSVLLVVAMMLTSLCTKFWEFILCQGILLGISCGLIFAPAFSVVGHYFFKKRAMAMAYASTGSPIGGTIFPVILTKLIQNPSVGFPWAQRVCGFLSLFLLLIAAVAIRPTSMRRKGNPIVLEAFKKPAYSLQVAGLFMVILGFWTPYFYIAAYAQDHGMSPGLASYLFAILNAGSFAGRMLGGTFSNHLGQFNVVAFSCYGAAIMLFCWLEITSSAGLIVFSVLFGATSGIIIALMMSTMAHCAPHPSQIGAYVGQSTFILGFAGLAGTPITGALISNYNGYSRGIIFSGSVMMAGAVLFTFARYTYAKDKLIA
ncbi:MFS general substrate transporter [Coniochaeta ligniaria NRRL 30616]|uniref:MFS general substrate transporter n=1 Tax=Coniochaeta ligniaria NRRL 30616 TaxID=1408157 RepID=A0A1J7IKT6_9PEZI|nr:MFS general substrate transporter [Coniochaeta ligniaria NRRL 30616]